MSDKKVIDAIDKSTEEDNLIKLKSGVVLLGKKANPLTLIEVMAAHPRPQPPTWINPTMGREMENPDDPDYIDRVKAWEMESSASTLSAFILLGTEPHSVPKGFPKHEDDAWLEEYSLLGIQMQPNNKSWRYLKWVTFKAVTGEEDLERIKEVVGRLSGVSEKSVQAAEEFPGRK